MPPQYATRVESHTPKPYNVPKNIRQRCESSYVNVSVWLWAYMRREILLSKSLVSHYSAIGDTISCDAPYSAIGFRGKAFSAIPPLLGLSLDCDRPCLRREVGVSGDSLRYRRKHSATGVLLHLSRDRGWYFGRVTKSKRTPSKLQRCWLAKHRTRQSVFVAVWLGSCCGLAFDVTAPDAKSLWVKPRHVNRHTVEYWHSNVAVNGEIVLYSNRAL